ncbi:MAG TPA: glycosyltransferase family 4 protein [Acidimicrobiales bacterium]|nr:glycosyltransferase family 4 protein [Acidimicrobiales bacterium]
MSAATRSAGRRTGPGAARPAPRPGEPLRIAYLAYRGNPHSGGQGVYTRYLTRELVGLGHEVEVFGGQPYPVLEDGVAFTPVPSLDLYRQPDPFRIPHPREFKSRVDALEFALMCTAGFPEPLTFSLRLRRRLAPRRADFDLIHDNQCFGRGLLDLIDDGWPLLATLHHPITVDRDLELAAAPHVFRRMTLRRWYGFLRMQMRVARQVPRIVTVSESSRRDVVDQMGVRPERLHVVPVGVDHERFRPLPGVQRVPGRLMTTASADVPLKGLVPLLEAVAKVRTERDIELVIVGKPRRQTRVMATIERLGLGPAVRFVSGVSDDDIVRLFNEAEVAVVPSLYEGFSLPAIEAMACGTPLVATTGGALPEVVGEDGRTGLLVPPNDPEALAAAIGRALDDATLRTHLGAAGRSRVLERFTWRACAEGTVENYWALLDEMASGPAARSASPLAAASSVAEQPGAAAAC